ncbi:glycosyltransferase [Helicobacter anatolicus]|uniref:glycosyltransferase n=1 Tax=Helicobacter anatolicus TaxID=2905874 RepID=UPI001E4FC878|nr:glycosyltransferase [Helicobacter anatolicus]MCE3038300.1 glycosyltransferase [Helicobacter anatolicus]
MPFFSIIIPIYNVENYLKECLDSAVFQTFRDIEIICINDGSSDKSGEIAKEYAEKDSRILLIHQENQGLSMARNNAITRATGKYIVFLDSDDYIEKNLCEKLYEILQNHPVDIIKYKTINHDRQTPYPIPPKNPLSGKEYILFYPNCLGSGCVWLFTVKREFLLTKNITFIPNIIYEDMTFIAHILLESQTFLLTDNPLYFYRVREDSITNTPPSLEKNLLSIKSYFEIAKFFYDIAQNMPEKIQKILLRQIIVYYNLALQKCDNPEIMKQIKKDFKIFAAHIPKKIHLQFFLQPIKIFLKKTPLYPIFRFFKLKIKRKTFQ